MPNSATLCVFWIVSGSINGSTCPGSYLSTAAGPPRTGGADPDPAPLWSPVLGGLALAVSALVAMVIPLPNNEIPQPVPETAAETNETRTDAADSSESDR